MESQAFKVACHSILDIAQGFLARVSLAHATRKGWAFGYINPIFILFKHDAVSHGWVLP